MTTLKQRFEDRFTEEKQPIGNYSGTFLDWKEHVVPLEVLEFISSECERARGEAVQEQRGRWAKHEQWFYEQLVGVLLHSPHFWDVIVKKVRHGDSIGDAPTTSLTHTKL